MDKYAGRTDEDLFVNALQEEARIILAKVGSLTPPRMLIENCLDKLQALASGDDGTDKRSEEEIWNQIREVLVRAAYATRPYCVRCGTCCREGSPTLHVQDMDLFVKEILKPTDIYTIRTGEPTYWARTREQAPATEELIKIREMPGGTICTFYDEESKDCRLYESRPYQCKKQECWNPDSSQSADIMPKLTRKSVLERAEDLWKIIQRHEERCSHQELARALARLSATKGRTVQEVIDVLSYDQHVRDFTDGRFHLEAETLDFFFGRPLREIIPIYGLTVQDQPDGSFLLKPIESQESEQEPQA